MLEWLRGKYQHENKGKDRPTWTPLMAFVIEPHIVALYFCSCKHVFKGFDFFVANGRQVLLAIYKRSHKILDSLVGVKVLFNLCESPNGFFSCLRIWIMIRLWKHGPRKQKNV